MELLEVECASEVDLECFKSLWWHTFASHLGFPNGFSQSHSHPVPSWVCSSVVELCTGYPRSTHFFITVITFMLFRKYGGDLSSFSLPTHFPSKIQTN